MRYKGLSDYVAGHDAIRKPSSLQNEIKKGLSQGNDIQTKLKIGNPDDPLEHEADNMADTILQIPEPTLIRIFSADYIG